MDKDNVDNLDNLDNLDKVELQHYGTMALWHYGTMVPVGTSGYQCTRCTKKTKTKSAVLPTSLMSFFSSQILVIITWPRGWGDHFFFLLQTQISNLVPFIISQSVQSLQILKVHFFWKSFVLRLNQEETASFFPFLLLP